MKNYWVIGGSSGIGKALVKIRVNAIAPSLTDTPLASKWLSSAEKREANVKRHPSKRIGTPEKTQIRHYFFC